MKLVYNKPLEITGPPMDFYTSEGTWIRFSHIKKDGLNYVDLRIWYKKHDQEEGTPTPKGIMINSDRWNNEILPALNKDKVAA